MDGVPSSLEGLAGSNVEICLSVTAEFAILLERNLPGTVRISNFGATQGVDSKFECHSLFFKTSTSFCVIQCGWKFLWFLRMFDYQQNF